MYWDEVEETYCKYHNKLPHCMQYPDVVNTVP